MSTSSITTDDPRAADVRLLLQRHLDFANTHSPPEDVHALDVDGLVDPDVTFVSCRVGRRVVAVGALKSLDGRHAELKSMHTAREARGRGFGRAIVEHLLDVARERGIVRVSLETGTMVAFDAARRLYASMGFVPCGPFGGYPTSRNSTFMTLRLGPGEHGEGGSTRSVLGRGQQADRSDSGDQPQGLQ